MYFRCLFAIVMKHSNDGVFHYFTLSDNRWCHFTMLNAKCSWYFPVVESQSFFTRRINRVSTCKTMQRSLIDNSILRIEFSVTLIFDSLELITIHRFMRWFLYVTKEKISAKTHKLTNARLSSPSSSFLSFSSSLLSSLFSPSLLLFISPSLLLSFSPSLLSLHLSFSPSLLLSFSPSLLLSFSPFLLLSFSPSLLLFISSSFGFSRSVAVPPSLSPVYGRTEIQQIYTKVKDRQPHASLT